jgi:hypothetical protein
MAVDWMPAFAGMTGVGEWTNIILPFSIRQDFRKMRRA